MARGDASSTNASTILPMTCTTTAGGWLRLLLARASCKAATVRRSPPNRYQNRWDTLPEHLRVPQQLAGVGAVACGATHSIMEKCNFACTSCYLSDVANYTAPLPFEQVQVQLDELRDHLGPGGKCQITSGEVTLLDPHNLGRIVAYAKQIGLDPMVMTNGQRLLQISDYLPTLVGRYGLEKIGFHVDVTQKGRPGLTESTRERDLHGVRDRFADLIRSTRRQTGKPLHAGSTVTVTERNYGDIPDVVRWALDNADSVRIISFLPAAEVGRIQDRRIRHVTMDGVWEKVCEGVGVKLNRHAMHYGHTECSITVPVLIATTGDRHHVVEVVREGRRWDLRVFSRALREFSHCVDLNNTTWRNLVSVAVQLMRRPSALGELTIYSLYRLWAARRVAASLAWHLATLRRTRVRPLLLVVHRFMSPDELDTPVGQERLQACVFKLPVDGEMVSMCEMNATHRLSVNLRHTSEEPVPTLSSPEPSVWFHTDLYENAGKAYPCWS